MKLFLRILALLALLFVIIGIAFAYVAWRSKGQLDTSDPVGVRQLQFVDEARGRELTGYIWYPLADTDPQAVTLHDDNLVFHGFPAIDDARAASASLPLVILSHGSGGNRASLAWLAVDLARAGALVVAINHPGSTSGDSAAATNIRAWNRPMDISRLLDELLNTDTLDRLFGNQEGNGMHLDHSRMAIVGHSLGGYTSLALSGLRIGLDDFIDYCENNTDSPDCVFYREGGVDLSTVDRQLFEQSLIDERLRAAVAIDPAYARSITNVNDLSLPLLLVGATAEADSGYDLQIGALAEELGTPSQVYWQSGAHHFSFLPSCKPFGATLIGLFEAGAEIICSDEMEGMTRNQVHRQTSAEIISFLQSTSILH